MRRYKLSILAAMSALWLPAALADEEIETAPEERTLTVSFIGAPSQDGVMMIAVFDNEEDFLKNAVQYQNVAIDTAGAGQAVFLSLAKTQYAVSIIHDEDENGKLSLGFLGIPKEKYGFSNGAKGRFGPPDYEDAVIDIVETASIEISLGGD
ncbi:MAG: DUF2141 domain-containing protein [Pseudomonadota bacterium]